MNAPNTASKSPKTIRVHFAASRIMMGVINIFFSRSMFSWSMSAPSSTHKSGISVKSFMFFIASKPSNFFTGTLN